MSEEHSNSSARESFRHQPHHDTHIVAIVALSIIALGVAYVVFTSLYAPESSTTEDQQASTTTTSPETKGVGVPQEPAPLSAMDTTADLPAGLIPESAEVVENYKNPDSESDDQRIVALNVPQTIPQLESFYNELLINELGFTIEETSTDEYGVKLTAGKAGERLVISIADAVNNEMDVVRVLLSYTTVQ